MPPRLPRHVARTRELGGDASPPRIALNQD
jgi:hypothetical protein